MTAIRRPKSVRTPKPANRVQFVDFEERACVPAWVVDHASFRRWLYTPDYPERGKFGFLGNCIYVDLSMERDAHNKLKKRCGQALLNLSDRTNLGEYYVDGMMLSHDAAGISNEPDGLFASWAAFQEKRIWLVGDSPPDAIELEGTPEMVLEVVSPSSVRKDTKILPELYWKAGVPEFWLVDPRGTELRFDLFQHTADGYRPVRNNGGWRKSLIFAASFRLTVATNVLGHPTYTLESR